MSKRHSAATNTSAERPAWHFFGGKGGVGKTTCAAAWALARAERGATVLVLSTDPAHSLGDAFARPLGGSRRRIPTRHGRLDAVELNSSRTVSKWIAEHRGVLGDVIERGTLLDADDVRELLTLPVPGLDELAAFLQLGAFDVAGSYDLIVVDTAPTGHTLRLLETPDLVEQLGRVLATMDDRDAAVRAALTGRRRAGPPAAIVSELHAHARAVSGALRDPSRCELWWVTGPEAVVVAETVDAIAWLRDRKLALKGIVVNRVTPEPRGRCSECDARRAFEAKALAPLKQVARGVEVKMVPVRPREPRGPAALREIAATLVNRGQPPMKGGQASMKGGQAPFSSFSVKTVPVPLSLVPVTLSALKTVAVPLSLAAAVPLSALIGGARVVFFGGKGGVGKTTCAAAVALAAAKDGRRVRLISVDPAPSLSDVLRTPVGDQWRQVAPRLLARELDARRVLDEYKARYRQAVSDIFDRLRGDSNFDASADRAVFDRLFDLAPPGLDEIVALLAVMSLTVGSDDETANVIVVDAAPTGHMLRLLAMPADAQRWVALLMRLMLKYQLTARAESLASDLVTLSRELRALSDLLRDRNRSRVVVVTRPAALPRLETSRLLKGLRRLRVAVPMVVVNAATTGTCAACGARRRAEAREIARLRPLCPGRTCVVMRAPLALPPPAGKRALVAWAERWTQEGGHRSSHRNDNW